MMACSAMGCREAARWLGAYTDPVSGGRRTVGACGTPHVVKVNEEHRAPVAWAIDPPGPRPKLGGADGKV